MIDENEQNSILQSIATEGSSLEENKPVKIVIAGKNHLQTIVDGSAGIKRIRHSIVNKFVLIVNQPLALRALSPLSIRCCLCSKVISYPAWYHSVQFSVNQFHYFVCFDRNSHLKPNAKCYRRF